jgi:hypothetical protein
VPEVVGPPASAGGLLGWLDSTSTNPASAAGKSSEAMTRSYPWAAASVSAATISMPITGPLGASRSWPWQAKQHLPGFMLLAADQGVLAVGAEPPVGPETCAMVPASSCIGAWFLAHRFSAIRKRPAAAMATGHDRETRPETGAQEARSSGRMPGMVVRRR